MRTEDEIKKELKLCKERYKKLKSCMFTTRGQIIALEWVLKDNK